MIIAKNKFQTKTFVIVIMTVMAVVTILVYYNKQSNSVEAADARNFNAGNIISDYVMTNKNSMTESQIQSFLKSKNSCNDTNLSKAAKNPSMKYNIKNGHFVCMADDKFNGETAAHIIWQAAQDYNINPQVLIILLQKEQGLITDTWPNHIQYRSATGYGCPDTAACSTKYYGLKNQVRNAARFFKAYQTNASGWYKPYWTGSNTIKWHPNSGCGTSTVNIANRATASLYSYTPYRPNQSALNSQYGTGNSCSSYGNRNFYMYFMDWFGDTQGVPKTCDSKVKNVTCVWKLKHNKGNEFLTTSIKDRDSLIKSGWSYIGKPFYAFSKQVTGSIPVYRFYFEDEKRHFYTTSTTERDKVKQNPSRKLEGIKFYVYPSNTSTNISYTVYRSLNSTYGHSYTQSSPNKTEGYKNEGHRFNVPSGMGSTPTPQTNRVNVYRTVKNSNHFYTTSLLERDNVIRSGFKYESVAFSASKNNSGSPVYRFYNKKNNDHFYTTSKTEKKSLEKKSAWKYEGVKFYIDNKTPVVYRLYSSSSKDHFYTSSIKEAALLSNKNNWKYEKVAFGKDQNNSKQPLYRMYSKNHGYFYSISAKEVLKIVNKNTWKFEGVAWTVSKKTTKTPVYRLYNSSTKRNFYTTSKTEKNRLVAKSSFIYRGISHYASNLITKKPIYRLKSKSTPYKHLFTANKTERNNAIKSGRWKNEGIAWYI